MKITINDKLKEKNNMIMVGLIEAEVTVGEVSADLSEEIQSVCAKLEESGVERASALKPIQQDRAMYKALGTDPARYRLSSEALARRVLSGKGLYTVNNIVDVNNLVSLKALHPVCAYDKSKIIGDITFTRGEEGESYEGIGRGEINITNLPVFMDENGKFGSTTSDSERTKITDETKEIVFGIVSFGEDENMQRNLDYAAQKLEKYADAKITRKEIVI